MADHWVTKHFPPKFEFKTVEELLQREDLNATKEEDNKYRRIYHEMLLNKDEENDIDEIQNISNGLADASHQITTGKSHKEGIINAKTTNNCIWTNEEIRILRKTFQKSKLQNVYLTGIVNSLRQELQTSKEKQFSCEKSYKILKDKWFELKKRYKRTKISCKCLKEDLKSYHSSLKSSRDEIEMLNSERNAIFKELDETKMLLEAKKVKNLHLKGKLDEKDSEKALAIQHCEFVAKQQLEFEVHGLNKEIYCLKKELEKEKHQNEVNTKSIDNLRNHFVSLRLNNAAQLGSDVLDPSAIVF